MQNKKILAVLAVALTASILNPAAARPTMGRGKRLETGNVSTPDRQSREQQGATKFSIDFFKTVMEENAKSGGEKNVVVSPFSLYEVLSMVANGAAGGTREKMAELLGVKPDQLEKLNEHNKANLALLNQNKSVELAVANAIYADNRSPFKKSFTNLCHDYYQAEVENLDFADEKVLVKINDWCKSKTRGKIAKILDKLSPLEKMVLLNSVYFKGKWDEPFEKNLNTKEPFNTISGASKTVTMMHREDNMPYLKGKGFAAVSLKYAGLNQELLIFLPDKDQNLKAFTQQLTGENFADWQKQFAGKKVALSLPKFTINYGRDLSSSLKAMGIADAFSASADFSNLIQPPAGACISRVVQKTFIDVNEEGTEAAAVTAGVMGLTSCAMPVEPVQFKVDRPFMLALMDSKTGEVLFLGSIGEPK